MDRRSIRKLAVSGPSATMQALINIVSIAVTVVGIVVAWLH